jgi:hypothetical protein
MPVQRLMRYSLLLKELLKNTDSEHGDWGRLKLALGKVKVVATKVDRGAGSKRKQRRVSQMARIEAERLEETRILAMTSLEDLDGECNGSLRHQRGVGGADNSFKNSPMSMSSSPIASQRAGGHRLSSDRGTVLKQVLRRHSAAFRAASRFRGAASIANRRRHSESARMAAAAGEARRQRQLADKKVSRNDDYKSTPIPHDLISEKSSVDAQGARILVRKFEDGRTETCKLETGVVVTRWPDGSRLYVFQDGVRLRREPDGTKIQTSPKGMVLTVRPDGSRSQVNPGGSETHTTAGGVKVTRHVNGVEILRRRDGSRLQTNPDGSTIERMPNGIRRTTYADGTVKTRYPDGRWVQVNVLGVQIVRHIDGVMVQTDPDGTTIFISPDGSTLQESPDGSCVEQNADGVKVLTAVDGRQFVLGENDKITDKAVPKGFNPKVHRVGNVRRGSSAHI